MAGHGNVARCHEDIACGLKPEQPVLGGLPRKHSVQRLAIIRHLGGSRQIQYESTTTSPPRIRRLQITFHPPSRPSTSSSSAIRSGANALESSAKPTAFAV